ncbi:hypothetical protein [Subtercola sp. RTI3]|uniref:hypothetical protein n=1 Tax=Subtercola sp. RTI3 TaxID=3048639 RepID=UPI002B22A43C|nr:hypothetical protein [Subtercola sp. RTI3]MEA9986299.1 hypothetical protein [Subtercola sp. RTI3]
MRINGARGYALLIGAVFCLTRALAYFSAFTPDDPPLGLTLITQGLVNIDFYAGLWSVVAVFCIVGAFKRRDSWSWAALVGVMTLWGLAYFAGWVYSVQPGDPPESREWLTAVTYLAPAAIIGILSPQFVGRKNAT